MESLVKQNYLSELNRLDWDFDGANGSTGLAGYHWYPARFVPNVPGILIGYFSQPGEVVLDPFCGSGTTLVEAVRLGRSVVGLDTNPAAILMTRAKLVNLELGQWERFVNDLRRSYEAYSAENDYANWSELRKKIPNFDENGKWYHPDTLRELLSIWESIGVEDSEYRVVAEAGFSAILRFVCSQNKHWGWICDNVWPKELVRKPAASLYFQRLEQYRMAAMSRGESVSGESTSMKSVSQGDCAALLDGMSPRSVDTVVTSPPYFGTTDYVRSQRLTFLWFGWSLERCRSMEIGARYKRRRLTALNDYLGEMERSFRAIRRVLKPDGMCAIVISESPNRQSYLDEFERRLVETGFHIEGRLTRNVSKRRVMTPQVKQERIVLARRLSDEG